MADDDVDARLRQAEFDLLYQRMMRRRAPSPVEPPAQPSPVEPPAQPSPVEPPALPSPVEAPAQPAAEETPTAAAPATTPRKRRRRDPAVVRNTRAYARAERNSIVLADSSDEDECESSSTDDIAPSTCMEVDVPDNTDASPRLLLPLTATKSERQNAPRRVFLTRTRQATPRQVRRSRKERHVHPSRYSVAAAQCYARLDAVAALLRPPDFTPRIVVFGSFGPLTTCAVPMPPRLLPSSSLYL
ncbi:hypothetical protein SDRG_13245 [Saprolegnia diclina VS20]|uniref:Uncharacterized protein n=1 Tax=Saprolegnia diclina (strain VS20) TaxID=1156394 RepID=T0Q6J9_SAPDV|nr:hypothetical protein SDRG_13245 [Saprolegnia diclina VS20]EQC29085.1 hypothetical protein SDRG_13245 [Saprolegnia diclina VS20]|eukprot:XP_008617544.1 hypothetical protein SDRG_13245 [Saprolegnia diclina VS20]